MYNVYIDSNDLGCKNIYLTANTNGAPFQLFNSTINNNTNVDRIIAEASLGGSNLLIERNAFCGNGVINAPGFATVNDNGNATVNTGAGNQVSIPTAVITSPADGIRVNFSQPLTITASYTDADSVQFFVNTTALGPYVASSVTSAQWTTPEVGGSYFISVRAKNSEGFVWSEPVRIVVGSTSGSQFIEEVNSVFAYPNPSSDVFHLVLPAGFRGQTQYSVVDFTGKELMKGVFENNNPSINLSTVPQGLYQILISNRGKQSITRLLKK
jgi:hypothetical protein